MIRFLRYPANRVVLLLLACGFGHAAGARQDTPRATPVTTSSASPLTQYADELSLHSLYLERVEIAGGRLLDEATISAATRQYEGREVSYEELQELRRMLTIAAVERGYINSGVVLPEQTVNGGVVRFEMVEGTLDTITLHGNEALRSNFIESRFRSYLGSTLNINEVESSLRLMQRRPMIAQINAEIRPGPETGTSILDLRVMENDPRIVSISANNYRPPSIGEGQLFGSFRHRSLFGLSDTLSISYALTEGLDDIFLAYSIPLTGNDLAVDLYYSDGTSDIVENPFAELDIVSEIEVFGLRAHRPIIRSLFQSLDIGLTVENKRSRSTLLGQGFSFFPGENLGESEVSVVRLDAGWSAQRGRHAFAVKGTLSGGVDWLDATISPGDAPDSDFVSFLLQLQYAHRLDWRSARFLARVSGQVTDDPLLPVEKIALGGRRTVRGYRENQLVRDEGLIAGIELQVPVLLDDRGENAIGLSLAAFADYGIARDKLDSLDTSASTEIASVGVGLLYRPRPWLSADVYYGEQLNDPSSGDDSLQGNGFHVGFEIAWGF